MSACRAVPFLAALAAAAVLPAAHALAGPGLGLAAAACLLLLAGLGARAGSHRHG